VGVGILFAVAEAHAVLRNQRAQSVKHVSRHVGVGVLVDCEARGGVLYIEHNHTFPLP
jgi:predicted molibdopterin-dependent oxidoreductase YjgC